MTLVNNPITDALDKEAGKALSAESSGQIAVMTTRYDAQSSKRLLGFLLDMGYDEMRLVTCDAWKRNCGGVPRNSFVIVKLNEKAAGVTPGSVRRSVILARISETATTPVANDVQSTIFQIHKVQAQVDPLTDAELQWGALKATILGTYYDDGNGIGFGNDVDNFMSPHFYEVYVPTEDDLDILVNAFVHSSKPLTIGHLRYTETATTVAAKQVEVRIAPEDFIANRTALFGKTRMGKSNTIKVGLDTMLSMDQPPGQVVFDLSGEYTYPDPQTGSSIFLAHRARCTRYSLRPRYPNKDAGVAPPSMLRSNFYTQIQLGHSIIRGLFDTVHARRPDYMAAFLGWEPVDEADVATTFPDPSTQQRYLRALAMYKALLYEAGFKDQPPSKGGVAPVSRVNLVFSETLRTAIAGISGVQAFAKLVTKNGKTMITNDQDLQKAVRLYEKVWDLYDSFDLRDPAQRTQFDALFPVGSTGKPYFEPIHVGLLRMIGDRNVSGAKKLTPFTAYHDPAGSDVVAQIVADVAAAKTVLIDLANADPVVANYYSEMVTRAVLSDQMRKFSEQESEEFSKHSVLFYFEEAHNLFRSDDKDLTSVYNKLAKEGAKFRIGMVYATQSMTTLSPDLLKNTENFFIAHLNDDREIREIERRYEFNGIGLDVQRARSKGYVRMITLSHRYALPVQIRLFQPQNSAATPAAPET